MESSTSITVRWGPVECRHRNGEITGYYVRYGEEGGSKRRIDLLGAFRGGMTTISELMKQTIYTVEVAARTSADTPGIYSDPQTIETPDSECQFLLASIHMSLCVVHVHLFLMAPHGFSVM